LFPEAKEANGRDLRRVLITVPSCDTHNSNKSTDDEYLRWSLTTHARANTIGTQHAMTKVMRSVGRAPAQAMKRLSGGRDVPEGIALPAETERIDRCLILIARGLYLHEFGERWLGSLRVHSDFLVGADGSASAGALNFLNVVNGGFGPLPQKGANPDVFWFKVLREGDRAAMRLCFYGGCTATAIFGTPPGRLP
jgi:hypothetical protein